jgi:Flp pilus assembly protein TadG
MRARPVLRLLRPPRPRRLRGERGSFTFAVIFWALMVMMLAGLVVDGGLAITERQNAGDIAEQAARAGADQLNLTDLRNDKYVIDKTNACNKAEAVAVASGLAKAAISCAAPLGTTKLPSGQVVPTFTVEVTITYSPILLGMFYSSPLTAHATATAYPQPGT